MPIASHAIDRGATLTAVRSTLGHGNIATTSGYLHARPEPLSGLKLDPGVFLRQLADVKIWRSSQTMRTILIVGVVLLVTLAATVLPKHQGNVGIAQTSGMVDNTYDVLRRQALTLDATKMGIAGGDNIWAVTMDLPVSSAIATVVAFADGSASIYLSSGGGFIGGGQKPPVRQAAQTLVAAGAAARASFTPTTTFPLPAAGQVRFYARAGVGVLVADASEEALKSGRHALSPLFMAAQRIITAYRGLESKQP